ncbi:MAG: glycosyltransferase family 1 protein [Planctomycetota bacterium]|nr:MAG: glycosyltransferase family 1 protein [Planctomycetota bacterium]
MWTSAIRIRTSCPPRTPITSSCGDREPRLERVRALSYRPRVSARSLTLAHVDAESGFSGGEVQVFLLLEGLRERGHRCVLFAPPGSRAAAHALERKFDVRAVPMRNQLDVPGYFALRRELGALEPDLVHLHTGRAAWLGGLAARSLGLPAIVTRRMDRRVSRGVLTKLVYGAHVRAVAAISPAIRDELARAGVDAAKLSVIASSFDPARIATRAGRELTRRGEGVTGDEPVLLVLASLVRRKGHDVLLEALARLRADGLRPRLWIAGEGSELVALDAQARKLELREQVRFLKGRADVGELLAGCDVCVLPSRQEGLGVAALEGLAAERPVIASRVGGLATLIEHEVSGLLVPPEDPAALAAALARVLRDPALAARLARAGRERALAAFAPQRMVDAYEELYRRVLA